MVTNVHDDDKRIHRDECQVGRDEPMSLCDCPEVYEVIGRVHYLELTVGEHRLVAPVGTPIPGPGVPLIPGLWIDKAQLPSSW
jgi:hypothetical protein